MESQVYESSPFANYLQDVEISEAPIRDDATKNNKENESRRLRSNENENEKIKYMLATSALLSSSLQDALELYPPLSPLSPPRKEKGKGKKMIWPRGWEKIGQTWKDQSLIDNLVSLIQRGGRYIFFSPTQDNTNNSFLLIDDSIQRVRGGGGMISEKDIETFIEIAQRLDIKIDQILPVTPELNRSLASSLTSLLELYQTATKKLSGSLPTSSALSKPVHHDVDVETPPPISRVKRSHHHQVTASLSELHRHASRAFLERREIQKWEQQQEQPSSSPSSSLLSRSLPPSTTTTYNEQIEEADPFHPTETFFGGLERKSSTRSNASAAGSSSSSPYSPSPSSSTPTTTNTDTNKRRHNRLRPSVGNVGIFGIGTAAATSTTSGGGGGVSPLLRELGEKERSLLLKKRRRPVSMSGWIPSSSSSTTPLVFDTPIQLSTNTTNSRQQQEENNENLWEICHSVRKSFIWSLIALLDHQDEDVDDLGETETEILERIFKGFLLEGLNKVEEEINDLIMINKRSSTVEQQQQQQQQKKTKKMEEIPTPFDDNKDGKLSLSKKNLLSTVSLSTLNSPSSCPRQRQRQRPPPPPPIDFSPPSSTISPTIQALNFYEIENHSTILNTINRFETSLKQILKDLKQQVVDKIDTSEEEEEEATTTTRRIEELIKSHDGLKDIITLLAQEWSESRIQLRKILTTSTTRTRTTRRGDDGTAKTEQEDNITFDDDLDIDNNGSNRMISDELDSNDAPPEEEEGNASLDDGSRNENGNDYELDYFSRQAIIDAALSSGLGIGFDGEGEEEEEKVFEAIAGTEQNGGNVKLSREERVKKMKEAREALNVGKQATATATGGGESDFQNQRKMVGELRQVLKSLGKGKEEREI